MMRILVLCGLLFWTGAALVLSEVRWFARRPLTERLRPYTPGGLGTASRGGLLSVESFREVIAPLSNQIGERVARLFGVNEDLNTRLSRVQSQLDPTAFRVRQLGWSLGAFGAGALFAVALGFPPAVALLLTLSAPLLTFLVLEQRVASSSTRWQRRLFLELPVVSEQIGMLLSAGYSLGAALNRTAVRSRGVCGQDLGRVCNRIRQGLTEIDALREWAELADVDALARLVQVLALNRESGDLGRMISEEARAIRRDVQRELVEQIERRSQQVWIPVTVATLVPGTLFLAVPFIEAMRLFSGS